MKNGTKFYRKAGNFSVYCAAMPFDKLVIDRWRVRRSALESVSWFRRPSPSGSHSSRIGWCVNLFHFGPERTVSINGAIVYPFTGDYIMGKKLYVGNLSYQVDSSELEQLFGQHGTVVSAQIINDRDTGRIQGFRLRRDGHR